MSMHNLELFFSDNLADCTINVLELFHVFVDSENRKNDNPNPSEITDSKTKVESLIKGHSASLLKYYERNTSEILDPCGPMIDMTHSVVLTAKNFSCFHEIVNSFLVEKTLRREDSLNKLKYNAICNGILLMLQSLSPNSFKWHCHTESGSKFRFCCRFEPITCQELESYYTTLSILVCAIGDLQDCAYSQEKLIQHFNSSIPKFCCNILKILNVMLRLCYLPVKSKVDATFVDFSCNEAFESFVPDNKLYELIREEYYRSHPLPSCASLTAARVITKCFCCILCAINKNVTDVVHMMLPSLLIMSNLACEAAARDVYEVLITLLRLEPKGMKNYCVPLEETYLKEGPVLSTFSENVEKYIELYVKLTITLYNDHNTKIYEYLESIIDRITLNDNWRCTRVFFSNYRCYLEATPLAAAATLSQMMELIFVSLECGNYDLVSPTLDCLEDVLLFLPEDAAYYYMDICYRLMLLYLQFKEGYHAEDVNELIKNFENVDFGIRRYFRFDPTQILMGSCTHCSQENRDSLICKVEKILRLICQREYRDNIGMMRDAMLKCLEDVHAAPATIDSVKNYYELFNSSVSRIGK